MPCRIQISLEDLVHLYGTISNSCRFLHLIFCGHASDNVPLPFNISTVLRPQIGHLAVTRANHPSSNSPPENAHSVGPFTFCSLSMFRQSLCLHLRIGLDSELKVSSL